MLLLRQPQPPSDLLLLSPSLQHPNPDVSFERSYREACKELVSFTRSTSIVKGLQLHARLLKSGLDAVPLVFNHLINLYAKFQLPLHSLRVFDDSPLKSSTTWNSLISSFTQNNLPSLALLFFRRMLIDSHLPPDDYSIPSAAKSCALLSLLPAGSSLHSLASKSGHNTNVFVASSLVDMYAKCGDLVHARKLFDEMPFRNVVSWSGMISGYSQMGEDIKALGLFKSALNEGLNVNDFTLSTVAHACGNMTFLEMGRQIHCLCSKTSFTFSNFVCSALISLYSKCGAPDEAHLVFDQVPIKNLGMWNALLIACAQHGDTSQCFNIFEQMKEGEEGVKPNFITFLSLLYACSHRGLVEEGKRYFGMMTEYGITPGEQHYASVVDLLGRAGRCQEAMGVIQSMPMEPTECVWGALLTGCRIHGDTELAVYAADKVFELGPTSSGMHILMSNAYAAAGRWEEAAMTRKILRDRGSKKETGLSWVEEGNRVHSFVSGDRSHPKSAEIYEKVEEMWGEMVRAGYVADTGLVLKEVGMEEKAMTIKYHSERLAIAFCLISFPLGRPIRVMKNLRVCGDCHNAIKFMSRCSDRVIILRDNNRFHRFDGGKCSCNDYW